LESWLKTRGIEVFYGHSAPSVLGQFDDNGDQYRLEGTLAAAPDWLVEELIPKQSAIRAKAAWPTRPRRQPAPKTEPANPDVQAAVLSGLPKALAELEPKLGKSSVGWRRKDLEGREIWIGRCPFPHNSGSSNDSDLSAGFYSATEEPFVRCKHSSCTAIPVICRRLV
jgi:hypothetical protein